MTTNGASPCTGPGASGIYSVSMTTMQLHIPYNFLTLAHLNNMLNKSKLILVTGGHGFIVSSSQCGISDCPTDLTS